MTVQRYRDGAWGEVNKVGKPLDDASVNVRREGEWQEIWPPSDIPDSAVLHLDATQEDLNDDDPVSSLVDRSGESNNLSGGTATFKTNVQNGNPVYRFDGVDDEYTRSSPTTNQPYTFIYVVQTNDNDEVQTPFSTQDDDDERATLDHRLDGQDLLAFAGNSVGGASTTTNWQIISGIYDGASSVVRRNGADVLTRDVGTHPWGGFRVGDHYFADHRPLDGDLGELLFYTTDLSDTDELAQEEQRLSDKWGISLN